MGVRNAPDSKRIDAELAVESIVLERPVPLLVWVTTVVYANRDDRAPTGCALVESHHSCAVYRRRVRGPDGEPVIEAHSWWHRRWWWKRSVGTAQIYALAPVQLDQPTIDAFRGRGVDMDAPCVYAMLHDEKRVPEVRVCFNVCNAWPRRAYATRQVATLQRLIDG